MHIKNRLKTLMLGSLLSAPIIFPLSSFAVPQTYEFTYDTLGRLSFSSDNVNGNRDFDYDAAGNRLRVTVGTANDIDSEPGTGGSTQLSAPTGLHSFGPISQYGGYQAEWNQVSGATYYIYRTTANSNNEYQINSGANRVIVQYDDPAKWVKACNSSGCSDKAYF